MIIVVVQNWSDGELHFSHVIGPFSDNGVAVALAAVISSPSDSWVEASVEYMECPL